jgi:tetratricopeptide (TPR) repeat protein
MTLFELTLEPEALVIFLNSLGVLSLLAARERILSGSSPWGFFLPGILLGLSVITKPNGLLFLPPAILWIGWMQIDGSIRMKASLFLLLGFFLVVSPITLRNYFKFQDFILITADGGKVFYHGNGPGSTGMERADLPDQGFREEGMGDPDPAHALFRRAARSISEKPLKPSECSAFWFRRTLDFMSSRPLSAFFLVGKKFFYFWGNYEVHEIDSNYKYDLMLRRWPLVPFGVLSILGIVGMVLARKKFRQAFLLYSMVGVYLLSVLIFFAASRYRLPAAPFLALFAAYALTSFCTLWQEKRRVTLLALLGFSVLLWPLINLPFRSEVQALERWQVATRIHYSLGGNFLFKKRQYREAVEEYQKSLDLAPQFAPAYNRLGMAQAILGELEEAEKNFRKVMELAPDMDQGYLNLGMVHLLKGEPEKALPLLEKALSLNPENARAREQLQNLRP